MINLPMIGLLILVGFLLIAQSAGQLGVGLFAVGLLIMVILV